MVRFKCGYGEGMYEDKQGEYVMYEEARKLISEAKRSQVGAKVKPACVPQERFGIYVSAINRIDDFFEYRYKALTPEEIKKQVMKYIDNITEQLSKSV